MVEPAAQLIEYFGGVWLKYRDLLKTCRGICRTSEKISEVMRRMGRVKNVESLAKYLPLKRATLDFAGFMVQGRGKTVYFSSLMV